MKHKVSELSGGLLDAAVALARGNQVKIEEGRAYILVPYDDGSQISTGHPQPIKLQMGVMSVAQIRAAMSSTRSR
jgi:hypothetical protein